MKFGWKNITATVTASGLIFGLNMATINSDDSSAFAQIRKQKSVGTIRCSGILAGSPEKTYNIQSATLENAKNGFTLILTVKGWKSKGWVSGDRVVYPVASDLKVYDVDYHNDGQTDTTLEIERNGKFAYFAMPGSRSICTTRGTLTFGNGVKQKLFR